METDAVPAASRLHAVRRSSHDIRTVQTEYPVTQSGSAPQTAFFSFTFLTSPPDTLLSSFGLSVLMFSH